MEPMTLAAGASAIGSIMGYKGNMASARQAEQVAEFNAEMMERDRVLLARRSRDQQTSLRQQSRQLAGSQVLATAASGVQLSGSPLLTLSNTYFNTEVDAQRIVSAGTEADLKKQTDIALTRMEGETRASNFRTAAYGSILSGMGSQAELGVQRDMLGMQSEYYKRQLQA